MSNKFVVCDNRVDLHSMSPCH